MKPVRIFRHIDCEGPGYLAEVLDREGVPWELVAIDRGEAVPPALDDVSGLVFMGGPMSVNDPLPWIAQELRLIRQAVERGIPVLGHCLGGQLIARALGGTVEPNPVKEIGWHPVRRVAGAEDSPWGRVLPEEFLAFHWHGETFLLPPGAELLLESEACARQAFAVGPALALQCHVEMTEALVREWVERYADELARGQAGGADTGARSAQSREAPQRPQAGAPGPAAPPEPARPAPAPGQAGGGAVQASEEILADLPSRVAALQRVADALYARWISLL